MNFSEYKNHYYLKWQKRLKPVCWTFFGFSVVLSMIVPNFYFLSNVISESRFHLYLIGCVIQISIHLAAIIACSVLAGRKNTPPEKGIKILLWLYLFQSSLTSLTFCRFELALLFPCTSLILGSMMFDKRLLKSFFAFSLAVIISESILWLKCFATGKLTYSILSISILVSLVFLIYLLSYYLCSLQRELIYSIYRGYTKHKKLNKELRLEPLTRLYNRTAYGNAVAKLIHSYREGDFPLIQVVLDLDNFKQINDTYGHSGGDAVLITLGEMISSSLGKNKLGFRYGGDEFVMIFNDRSLEEAVKTVNKLREDFYNVKFDFMKEGDHCSLSMGVAPFKEGWNYKQWFQAADAASYVAKTKGKNCVEVAR